MEQQELRVVLAHLRAISFETVKAVTEWRVSSSCDSPIHQTHGGKGNYATPV